jgi:hypothetical protein
MAKVDWVSLQTLDTGFVFARTHSLPLSARWDWYVECVCEKFDCDADDVDLLEDEDRGDLLTVKGEPVAEIHHRYVRADAVGAAFAREAA